MVSSWGERAAAKRAQILSQVPEAYIHTDLKFSLMDTSSVLSVPEKYLSKQELKITNLTPHELLQALSTRVYTAVTVLKAFVHRAAIAHQLTHCCLDFPYYQALATAEALDKHLEFTGNTIGPLHGLPVSVKDQCRLIATETTCGFVHPLGSTDVEDAVIVQLLKASGAVIFAKTSLSMGCMWGETVNNILGRSCNPFNRSFSCGGSSGGEGALIAMRGSVMGVGSDLGGSIRSPSCYNALYGMRPSSGRLPYYGMKNSMEGQSTVKSVVGPMTSTIEAMELFMKAIIDQKPWLHDPGCQPIPWRQEVMDEITSGRKLRIGIFEFDGICLPQPPVRNGLRQVAALLVQGGHEVFPWKLDTKRAVDLMLEVFRSDAAGDMARQSALSGEPMLENGCQTAKPPITLGESWDLAVRCESFRSEVLRAWNSTASADGRDAMDAYISCVNPAVAPRHGDYSKVRYFAYTAVANMLDYTACTIPIRYVDSAVDLSDDASLVRDANGKALPAITCERDETIRRKYVPEQYSGLPVCLQVVGRRMEEEKVIGIVKVLQRLLRP